MGFIEGLFRKKKELPGSFKNIHKHLDHQKEWIEHLHEHIKQLYKHANYIQENHQNHKEEVLTNIENLNSWVGYLHSSHKKLEKNLEKIEINIKQVMKKDLEKYHNDLLLYFENLIMNMNKQNPNLKDEILLEVERIIDEKTGQNKVKFSFDAPIKPEPIEETLTSGEKELLNFLFNENTPLAYEDISRKLGRSINSVRVYMNSLKSKKDIIDEFRTPKGVKIFSIKSKEKVKTLYNLH
ncbi:hypothetical protein JXB41_02530 [Candidatus Woesearchaeota archaeon]|nr:hypothetical protein [Candidatus Woesearchaeota archaeon]